MKEELVSIIIPVYKVEKYLKECLESVVNQTYKNLEIILVDDGSPDSCGKICDEYAKIDKRVKVIHKENGGVSSARNAGLDVASGSYISFVDSDDVIEKRFIETLYHMCVENNCDIATCDYERFKINMEEEKKFVNNIEIMSPYEMQNRLFVEDESTKVVVVWSKLYKKYLFDNMKFVSGKIHEDEEMIYKILYFCKTNIVKSDLHLYHYRENLNSIIGKKFNVERLDILYAYDERKNFYKEKGENELYIKSLSNYAETLRNCYLMVSLNIEKDKKDILKNILMKNKQILNEILKCNGISTTQKIKTLTFSVFPQIYVLKNRSKYMGEGQR